MHTLTRVQRLPITLEKAWQFFSSPDNLKDITPESMGFVVKSGGGTDMYPGMLIRYTVTPLFGIPLTWVTEITHVHTPTFFIDEQRVGPFAIWHHEHHFTEIPGGVEMTDILHYKMPFGLLGNFVHPLLVKGKIKEIFEYRNTKMIKLFGEYKG